ncbi:DMT family transporter [Sneathiella chinensis]|uniref:Membrane protein n=1 Tax=Sneathiella chinensis TaxID=349750 RepID=A0ABQ5U1V8_9PROT|nr:DMT family transporter [Sneathiella chinensis]GLQ05828.1 membrane protein [Sneathiella chinensis]
MTTQPNDNLRGAFLMAACMAAFGINDALMKLASSHFSLFQAMFIRAIFTTILLGGIAWYQKALIVTVPKGDRLPLFLRIMAELAGSFCFLTAIFNMPIANATAILQSMPLAVTLAAALFLGERVGWRRYIAVFIGFAGVMIIVRPGSAGFNEFSFFALTSVFFLVIRDLSTRKLSAGVPSIFVSLMTSLAILLATGIILPTITWQEVTGEGFAILLAAACFVLFGYISSVMAMRAGDIAFISPFRYTILIWSICLGMFIFGDIPDTWTIVGSTIVVGTGLYTFYREQVASKR